MSGRTRFSWPLILAALLCTPVATLGCSPGQGHDEHDHEAGGHDEHGDAGHEHGEHEEDVTLSADALSRAGIRVEAAGPRTIDETIPLRGEVTLNADAVAHVTVRAPGVARDVKAHVGQRVAEGDLLAMLDSPALGEAKIAFLDAKREAEIADADLARERTIHANTATLLRLLAAQPEYDALEAKLKGLSIGDRRASLLSKYAEVRRARAAFERARTLHEGPEPVVSQAEFMAARTSYESARADYTATCESVSFEQSTRLLSTERASLVARANVRNAERRLHVLGLSEAQVRALNDESPEQVANYELRAPIAGTVIAKHVTRGEAASESDALFVIADLSSVWVDLAVYPGDLHRVAAGQAVRLDCMGASEAHAATIAYVTPTAVEQTRSAIARCIVGNPDGHLRPGLTVTGRVSIGSGAVPVAVRASAVQRIEGDTAVFVEEEPGTFEARPVRLGRSDGTWVEVRTGVEPGARVATGETFILKAELGKAHAGHDHAH